MNFTFGKKSGKFLLLPFLFLIFFVLPTNLIAVSQLNISVANNNLYITTCSSQLQGYMGYKGYVDGIEVFTTGSFGGFPCYGGDLFIPDLNGFLSSYTKPLHLTFDFYTSIDFSPPVYGHFNLYYDGVTGITFDDTTHIVSFSVSTSTNSASVHSYIGQSDIGASINFKISTSTDSNIYTADAVVSTTTGDFYYSWNYPALTNYGEHTFYSDIASTTVLTSTSTVINLVEPLPTYSSILFLPGVKASRLYKTGIINCSLNCEDQLWEPNADSDVETLFLNPDGSSVDEGIYTRDVVDEAYDAFNIYKTFVEKLEKMKTVDGILADYSVVPYDWRLSNTDVLTSGIKTGNNISYIDATGSPYILSELTRLANNSDTGKVTIIAHSNGGLVTKVLLKQLADTDDPLLQKIDKVIFVAVPHLGTPMALPALLHGYEQGIGAWVFSLVSDKVMREFGQNLSTAYNLLPSDKYFTYVDDSVVSFDETMSDWASRYGAVIHSAELLHNFLIDSQDRVTSSSEDTETPTYLRETLLSSAETEHSSLDNWVPPTGIEVTEIAGWGVPTTVSSVRYLKENGKIKFEPVHTIDGDGTVVVPSALWSNGVNVDKYWVNEGQYNKDHILQSPLDVLKKKHAQILEIEELQTLINNIILATSTNSLPEYISTSTPISGANDTRLIYSIHSPVYLDIYDSLGNHTGVSTTTGKLEEQISGTYFIQYGEDKYIFTNTTSLTNLAMTGYGNGTFTFSIEQKQGDSTISTVTFKDIPTTPQTRVSMSVQNDINTLSDLNIDTDGNGSVDIVLTPVLNGVVTYTPPEPEPEPSPLPQTPSGGNGPITQSSQPLSGDVLQSSPSVGVVPIVEKTTYPSVQVIPAEIPVLNESEPIAEQPKEEVKEIDEAIPEIVEGEISTTQEATSSQTALAVTSEGGEMTKIWFVIGGIVFVSLIFLGKKWYYK